MASGFCGPFNGYFPDKDRPCAGRTDLQPLALLVVLCGVCLVMNISDVFMNMRRPFIIIHTLLMKIDALFIMMDRHLMKIPRMFMKCAHVFITMHALFMKTGRVLMKRELVFT